jgi:hypothetical protein
MQVQVLLHVFFCQGKSLVVQNHFMDKSFESLLTLVASEVLTRQSSANISGVAPEPIVDPAAFRKLRLEIDIVGKFI